MKRHLGVIFLVIRDNAILFEQKPNGQWLLPGGHINDGESPIDAVTRVAKEELGLELQLASGDKLFPDRPDSRCLPVPFAAFEHIVDRDSVLQERHINEVFAYVVRPLNEPVAKEGQAIRWLAKDELGSGDVQPAAQKIALAGFSYYESRRK